MSAATVLLTWNEEPPESLDDLRDRGRVFIHRLVPRGAGAALWRDRGMQIACDLDIPVAVEFEDAREAAVFKLELDAFQRGLQ